MNRDELVRRFVDGELSVQARREALQRASHDIELSTALLAAQELRAETARLHAMVPATTREGVERIMQRALAARQAQEASGWHWLSTLWRPRFRMSLGGMLMATAAVGLAVWGVTRMAPPQATEVASAPANVEREPEVATGVVPMTAPIAVRFVLPASGARSVSVVGDFNGWEAAATQLSDEDGDGVFATTVLLPRGSYGYMFVVDGERWTLDPYATNFRDDGFGQRNAVIRVN